MKRIICVTCLSRSRSLVQLDFGTYGSIFGDTKIALNSTLSVCWECAAMFRKLHNFKSQVWRAQELLNMVPQSLSSLKRTSIISFDVCCELNIVHATDTKDLEDVTMHANVGTLDLKIESDEEENKLNDLEEFEATCHDSISRDDEEKLNDYEEYEATSLDSVSRDDEVIKITHINVVSVHEDGDVNIIKKESEISNDLSNHESDTSVAISLATTTNDAGNSSEVSKSSIQSEHENVKDNTNDNTEDLAKNDPNESKSNDDRFKKDNVNYYLVNVSADELDELRDKERESQKFREIYKYKCDDCIVGFYEEEFYEKHMKIKHSESIGIYVCGVCKVRFPRISRLKPHVESHYTKYRCRLCPYLTYRLSQIKLHDAKEHGNMKHICPICSARFATMSSLRWHRDRVHEAPLTCDLCQKTYSTRSSLQTHMSTHKAKPSECHICHKKYLQLAQHILGKHGAQHEAYCAECDRHYASYNMYKLHLRHSKKHCDPQILKHKCTQCNATFVASTALKNHVLAVHVKAFAHKCDQCDKSFNREYSLQRHKEYTHEGKERPKHHVCHICDRAFWLKRILVNHVRTHTGERPFACSSCGAAFAQQAALRTHERGVHRADRTRNTRRTQHTK